MGGQGGSPDRASVLRVQRVLEVLKVLVLEVLKVPVLQVPVLQVPKVPLLRVSATPDPGGRAT